MLKDIVKPILLLDLGWGNLGAMKYFFYRLGYPVLVLNLNDYLNRSHDKNIVVIPGIGSAHDINKINKKKMLFLKQKLTNERLVLGVCLGMQLLCNNLIEANTNGLNIFDLNVTRLKYSGNEKPNIGYRSVVIGVDENIDFYFCHAYGVKINTTKKNKLIKIFPYLEFGSQQPKYAAIIRKDNFIGMQFHPEKSGEVGLNFIRDLLNE